MSTVPGNFLFFLSVRAVFLMSLLSCHVIEEKWLKFANCFVSKE